MGYTPKIFISWDDIKDKQHLVYKDSLKNRSLDKLLEVFDFIPLKIKGVSFTGVYSDLSSENKHIRNWLDENNIEYDLEN